MTESILRQARTLHVQGDFAGAGAAYERAIQAAPQSGGAYRDLGILFLDAGLLGRAAEAVEQATVLSPDDAGAHYHLGLIRSLQGRDADAIESYVRAIEAKPDYAEAYATLAKMAIDRGEYEVGERLCRQAIGFKPGLPQPHVNLGLALRARGALKEALAVARKGVDLDPESAPARSNLGNLYMDLGLYEEALDCFRGAVDLQPDFAAGHFNLGNLLRVIQRLDDSAKAHRQAIVLDPGRAEHHHSLGLTLQEMGERSEALRSFRQAHELSPENPGFMHSFGKALWEVGRYGEAFDYLEGGFAAGLRKPNRQFSIPRWQGEDISQKHILVWREQGLGDEIDFSRRYRDLAEVAGRVTIEADQRLLGMFRRSFPAIEFRAEDFANDGSGYDVQLPAGNLLRHFPYRDRELPGYLKANPGLIEELAPRVEALPKGLRVGICWRSQFTHRDRDVHYPPLMEWGPVLTLPGLTFVNLQYDDCTTEIAEAEQAFGIKIHRWPDLDLRDDLETAFALTSHLDLVLSASTAPVRIGDALGKKVWVMAAGAEMPRQPPIGQPGLPNHALWRRYWTETWQDLLPRVADALKGATR